MAVKLTAQQLIHRAQRMWERYYARPTKRNLVAFGAHLEVMKGSKAASVKKERSAGLRAFNREMKKQGWVDKKRVKATKTSRRRNARSSRGHRALRKGDEPWTATKIRELTYHDLHGAEEVRDPQGLRAFTDAVLWRLDPPIKVRGGPFYEYVITYRGGWEGKEMWVYGATADGKVDDWEHLVAGFGPDHERALYAIDGYKAIEGGERSVRTSEHWSTNPRKRNPRKRNASKRFYELGDWGEGELEQEIRNIKDERRIIAKEGETTIETGERGAAKRMLRLYDGYIKALEKALKKYQTNPVSMVDPALGPAEKMTTAAIQKELITTYEMLGRWMSGRHGEPSLWTAWAQSRIQELQDELVSRSGSEGAAQIRERKRQKKIAEAARWAEEQGYPLPLGLKAAAYEGHEEFREEEFEAPGSYGDPPRELSGRATWVSVTDPYYPEEERQRFTHRPFAEENVRRKCPTCNARAGKPCKTKSGKKTKPHAKRNPRRNASFAESLTLRGVSDDSVLAKAKMFNGQWDEAEGNKYLQDKMQYDLVEELELLSDPFGYERSIDDFRRHYPDWKVADFIFLLENLKFYRRVRPGPRRTLPRRNARRRPGKVRKNPAPEYKYGLFYEVSIEDGRTGDDTPDTFAIPVEEFSKIDPAKKPVIETEYPEGWWLRHPDYYENDWTGRFHSKDEARRYVIRVLRVKPGPSGNPQRNARRRHGKVRSMREVLAEEKLSKPKMSELMRSGEQMSPSRKRRLSRERRASEKAEKLPSRRRSRKSVREIYIPEKGEEISLIEEGTGDVMTAIVTDVYLGDEPSMWVKMGRKKRYLTHDEQDLWYVLKSAATRIKDDTPRYRVATGVVTVTERAPMQFNPAWPDVDRDELDKWDPRTVRIYQKLRLWIQDPLTPPGERDAYLKLIKQLVETMREPRGNPSKMRSIANAVKAIKNPETAIEYAKWAAGRKGGNRHAQLDHLMTLIQAGVVTTPTPKEFREAKKIILAE